MSPVFAVVETIASASLCFLLQAETFLPFQGSQNASNQKEGMCTWKACTLAAFRLLMGAGCLQAVLKLLDTVLLG